MFGDDMFKFIQHWLKTLMMLICASSRNEVIVGQYYLLMDELRQSNTLSELMGIKKNIALFKRSVTAMGSPDWATNYVMYLEARWNRKYRLWKSRD